MNFYNKIKRISWRVSLKYNFCLNYTNVSSDQAIVKQMFDLTIPGNSSFNESCKISLIHIHSIFFSSRFSLMIRICLLVVFFFRAESHPPNKIWNKGSFSNKGSNLNCFLGNLSFSCFFFILWSNKYKIVSQKFQLVNELI